MNTKKKILLAAILVCTIAAILYFTVFSSEKTISPGTVQPPAAPESSSTTVAAEVRTVTQWYDAVGTVIPASQARIEPQVAAQVIEVLVRAGDQVEKGDVLVRLEDDRLNAKLSQARQSLQTAIAQREQAHQSINAAEAAFSQARSSYQRIKTFFEAEAATEQKLEQAQSQFLQAQAALQRTREALSGAAAGIRVAEEMVKEAEISLAYATVTAPTEGEILKRLIDPGDMAMPGKPLLLLRTAGTLQLEADVRESLMSKIRPGETHSVHLTALDTTVEAVIDEVVPFIDPQTRTFVVKASLPEVEGTYPGMYGKLLIPYLEIPVILIPSAAIRQTGQLELVTVQSGDGWQQRYVKTGTVYGDKVEILSGLEGGEIVVAGERGNDDR